MWFNDSINEEAGQLAISKIKSDPHIVKICVTHITLRFFLKNRSTHSPGVHRTFKSDQYLCILLISSLEMHPWLHNNDMKFQVDLDPWVFTSNFKLKYFINEWMPGLDILTRTSYWCDLLMVSTRRLGNCPFSRKNRGWWVQGPWV